MKRVKAEDGPSLQSSGMRCDFHAIVAGASAATPRPPCSWVHPEGNWVDATADAPYFVIGLTSYGKPLLDRLLRCDTPLPQAVALAYLAFDATRASVVDVEFPIDMVVLPTGEGQIATGRFRAEDLAGAHTLWHERLQTAPAGFRIEWTGALWSGGGDEP